MGDLQGSGGKLEDSGLLMIVGKLMVLAVIVLFSVVVFVFFLHIYAKWFWYPNRENDAATGARTPSRRRRFDFAPGYQELPLATVLRRGLDSAVLKSIPVVTYSARDFNDGLECAVCLCEVSEGEQARLLPKCNHGFHVDCIDMWFQSHSTCPLCRNPVAPQSSSSSVPESTLGRILLAGTEDSSESNESPNFPTNMLFWGDDTQVSTLELSSEEGRRSVTSSQTASSSASSASEEGLSVLDDIPRQINEDEEESTKSPVATRLRLLRRILSRDRKINPCSPSSNIDVEQGSRSRS